MNSNINDPILSGKEGDNPIEYMRFAPPGYVWECESCGKISPHDKYGDDRSSYDWDESCFLNAKLIKDTNQFT